MTPRVRTLAGGTIAVGATLLLAGLSRAPQGAHRPALGALRLAWRATPERIEACRAVPEAELANLPRHMRQAVICEGRSAEYRLTVTSDGALLAHDTVHGGGARRDRPMYLYREFALAPGTHELVIRLERLGGADLVTAGVSRRLEALPATLELSRRIRILPRGVVLVTYDRERRELKAR